MDIGLDIITSSWKSILCTLGANSSTNSTSPPTISDVFRALPKKITEEIYQIRMPVTKPSLELVFFHGFELGDSSEAYWRDWLSQDQSQCWLETWLVEAFPGARILSVSFDSSLTKTFTLGRMDLQNVAENLIKSVIETAEVGQYNCPVILVGHSLGGLVMKKLTVAVEYMRRLEVDRDVFSNFLDNMKGLFFYSTPHNGSILSESHRSSLKGLLLKDLRILENETSRLNAQFSALASRFQWKVAGVGESHVTLLGNFRGVVVEEASSRLGMQRYSTISSDHVMICKPAGKNTLSFLCLTTFIQSTIDEAIEAVHECQGLPDYVGELVQRALEFEEILKRSPIVGILGMGGIGKTALARQVFNNISRQFEYTCFVDNVKGIAIEDLGNRILAQFHCNGRKVDGGRTDWKNLKGKRTLIVMDDVDSVTQLSLLPKMQHFRDGSHVIITTRDGLVVNKHASFEVMFLGMEQSKKLFCFHAFDQEDVPGSLKWISKYVDAVVRKCDGLPLTLEVLGTYLRDHKMDEEVWKETIHKLSEAKPVTGDEHDGLWCKLKVSYFALAPEERKMFIDAATFFYGMPLHIALAAWSTAHETPRSSWENLQRRCLVKSYGKRVWIHEQLRDMGKSLAAASSVLPSRQGNEESAELLNANQVNAEGKFLRLKGPRKQKRRRLQLCSLAKLKELLYVDIEDFACEGSCRLPSKLAILRWVGRDPVAEFPISLKDNDKLAVLELSNLKTGKLFTEELGKLTNLRILLLSGIQTLELPTSFGQVSRLEYLELHDIPLTELPNSFGKLSSLKHLTVDRAKLKELPESFGNLSSLVELELLACDNLAGLPNSFGRHLTSLQKLKIRHCPLLTRLPADFSLLSGLQQLAIVQCPLEELGHSFGSLSALQSLELVGTNVEALPSSFGYLSSLQTLDLSRAKKLKSLPSSFRELKSLTSMRMQEADELESLSHNFGLLESLQNLEIGAEKLETLPDSIGQLTALQVLSLDVWNLQSLPESIGRLSLLRALGIISGNIESLPENVWQLASLEELNIDVPSLKRLPDGIEQLSSLRHLMIHSQNVETLPEGVGRLEALISLRVSARRLKYLPESIGQLSLLRVFELECGGAETNLLERFRDLLVVNVRYALLAFTLEDKTRRLPAVPVNLPSLKRLPKSFVNLSSLEELKLDLPYLEGLPNDFGNLLSLTNLHLQHCEYLETLPESIENLSLRAMIVEDCKNLKGLPENLGKLSSSHQPAISTKARGMTLAVEDCPSLDPQFLQTLGWVPVKEGVKFGYQRKEESERDALQIFTAQQALAKCGEVVTGFTTRLVTKFVTTLFTVLLGPMLVTVLLVSVLLKFFVLSCVFVLLLYYSCLLFGISFNVLRLLGLLCVLAVLGFIVLGFGFLRSCVRSLSKLEDGEDSDPPKER